MKNLLILIVAIALFLHFYPQPKVERWYNEQKDNVLLAFADATDTSVRLKVSKVYDDLEPKLSSFNKKEKVFVTELTSSRKKVTDFYNNHCKKNVREYKLQSANQLKVCQSIGKFSRFL